jgi:hypothetical protein
MHIDISRHSSLIVLHMVHDRQTPMNKCGVAPPHLHLRSKQQLFQHSKKVAEVGKNIYQLLLHMDLVRSSNTDGYSTELFSFYSDMTLFFGTIKRT